MKSIVYRITQPITLKELAIKHNTTIERIVTYNKLKDDELYCGQRLVIPIVDGKIHTVMPFENLEEIAVKYGIDIHKIIQHNELDNDVVFIGQKILIPIE